MYTPMNKDFIRLFKRPGGAKIFWLILKKLRSPLVVGRGGGVVRDRGGRSGGTLRIRPGGPKNPGWTMSEGIFTLSGRRLEV